MNTEESVSELVESFRPPFQADGGDLLITRLTGNFLGVRILIGPDGCRECIVPAEVVAQILISNINQRLHAKYTVDVEITNVPFVPESGK